LLREFLYGLEPGFALDQFDAVAAVSFIHQPIRLRNAGRRTKGVECPQPVPEPEVAGPPPVGCC
jgi:hypothetical protein